MTAPLPPADLRRRHPHLHSLATGARLHRFHSAVHDPVHFDRSTLGRLNAPDGTYGVLYAAEQARGAFAETFLRTPGLRQIDPRLLASRSYVEFATVRPVMLIALTGPGLALLGATAEVLHAGLPYDVPQAWSLALHDHPVQADGIAYHARHDDEALCYALFDRADDALAVGSRRRALDDNWFWELAEVYAMGHPPAA